MQFFKHYLMHLKYKFEEVLKSSIICVVQRAGRILIKMLKYFEVLLNMFELPTCMKLWNLDWLMKIFFVKYPIRLLGRDNKTRFVPASFMTRKVNFGVKSVTVITVMIFLHCNWTEQTDLFTMLLQKNFEKSS